MVRFRPEVQPRFFEEATHLHRLGFVIDTMLPHTLTVFGSFDTRTCAWKLSALLHNADHIAEWKLDV